MGKALLQLLTNLTSYGKICGNMQGYLLGG